MNSPDLPAPRVVGQTDAVRGGWEQPLLARIAARDATALFQLRDRLGEVIFERVLELTGDRLVASFVTCGVFTRVWRNPAEFAGTDLRTYLLSMATSRARQWLASTDNPDATRLAARTWPQANDMPAHLAKPTTRH